MNPLKESQVELLKRISCEDLARKVNELAEEVTKINEQCFFGKEMTVNVCNGKEKIPQCFCKSYYDDEGILQDCTCGKCGKPKEPIKTFKASVGDYEYFENRAVKEYKRRLIEKIESWAIHITAEKNPRWVKNTIIDIIRTLK